MKTHKDLDAWKRTMDLVEVVYKCTQGFPSNEIYGLTSQVRRASVSVPSNIAEGAGRKGDKEFIQYLYIALGSLVEVETQLLIAKRLHYIDDIHQISEKI
ncbi:four helix bundle protein [Winogradskyella endarachnes]|uniref:Four helix bundle protein n=1 Tax=Winogradskyella endarachnes TaxID=2681965 RepID=A0A6L6UAS4_9FLAO|nr:four helix bundle protein [Winogradskyella endarachnes]MUU77864.1 four helix bundle protein [Winogradskyella endarachnes]